MFGRMGASFSQWQSQLGETSFDFHHACLAAQLFQLFSDRNIDPGSEIRKKNF